MVELIVFVVPVWLLIVERMSVSDVVDGVARLPLALGRACFALSGESLVVGERMTGACVSLDAGHF